MFGSEALEIAIGLVLLYLVLALVCTTLVEWIARILALRSKTLHAGIIGLLGTDLARRLYDHPLICGYARESRMPNPVQRPTATAVVHSEPPLRPGPRRRPAGGDRKGLSGSGGGSISSRYSIVRVGEFGSMTTARMYQ